MEEKDKFESNSAKRIRMLGIDEKEDIHLEEDKVVKGKFFPNLWYRYKWVIIVSAIFLLMFVVIMIQVANKDDYDVKIMYAGPKYIVPYTPSLSEPFTSLSDDYNSDGEKKILIVNITYQTEEQRKEGLDIYQISVTNEANKDALDQFEFQLMSGEVPIYLVDKALFDDHKSLFVPISEILGYQIEEDKAYTDSGIYFNKTDFAKYFDAYSVLPKDTVLCLSVKTVGTDDKEYDNAVDFFKKIVEFKAN